MAKPQKENCKNEQKRQGASTKVLISLSTQYKQKPLYFCIFSASHWHRLITTHCTDAVPPAAYMSLHDCSLMLHVQVMLFTQRHFNIEQSVHDLGHFQQFRQHLIEPAAIYMQWWYAKGATKIAKRAQALDQSVALWGSESAIRG